MQDKNTKQTPSVEEMETQLLADIEKLPEHAQVENPGEEPDETFEQRREFRAARLKKRKRRRRLIRTLAATAAVCAVLFMARRTGGGISVCEKLDQVFRQVETGSGSARTERGTGVIASESVSGASAAPEQSAAASDIRTDTGNDRDTATTEADAAATQTALETDHGAESGQTSADALSRADSISADGAAESASQGGITEPSAQRSASQKADTGQERGSGRTSPFGSGPQYLPDAESLVTLPSDEALAESGIPESLISLVHRNPETADYVLGYSETMTLPEPEEIDISGEVQEGEIPLFIQWDKRWGYLTYGDDLFGLTGCGPTCLAMVYAGLTGNTDRNPAVIAAWAEENGYYAEGYGTAWSMMETGCEDFGLTAQVVGLDSGIFEARLSEGKPIICSMGAGDFTDEGHFIVLTAMDEDGMVTVRDPNSPENSSRLWPIDNLLSQMNTAWAFSVA